ncbi:MAG: hypothetical protein IKE18_07420 [Oscillospiraceae bacterium]|nr:hypothetical protein [Oscillospiraceae bacterium]
MKEQYVKPLIAFESFSLTQTIARNCGDKHQGTLGESTHLDEYTCMWDLGGFTIFFIENGCDDGPDEEGDEYEIEGVCYNNPDGGQEIFSSY